MKTTMTLCALALVFTLAAPTADAAMSYGSTPALEANLLDAAFGSGYWKDVRVRVWKPGHWDRVWVDPVYRYQPCGGRYLVRSGYYRKVWHRGHYVWRTERVWVSTHRGHGRRGHGHRRRGDCGRY